MTINSLTNTSDNESFLQDFEAFALELLGNPEEMFPLYYMHCDMFSMFVLYSTYPP